MSRFQNHRHSEKYFVEVTFFDQIHNLRKDFDRLRMKNTSVSHKKVAQSYFGSDNFNRTMTMMASVAIRLPHVVLVELGKIINTERPDLYLTNDYLESSGVKTEEEMISLRDYRLYLQYVK